MRRLIVTNIVSLDGYFEGPGGDTTGLHMDHAFDGYNAERLRSADTLLVGRDTYDMFRSFWPHQAEDTDPRLLELLSGQDERLATIREISRLNNSIEKLVVSDSLTPAQTDPWRETTRIVPRDQGHTVISELKSRAGRDIVVFGSRTMWTALFDAGLVDELHLMVAPTVLGGGTPALSAPPSRALHLLGTRQWEGSDNVLLRYALED